MSDFVHLHVHTMGSLLDGFATPEEVAARANTLEQPAVAITDHGSLACTVKFYEECRKNGVKPIIGVEAYLADDMSSRNKEDAIYHIGFLAKNNEGLQKLFRISEAAWNIGFYKKPRVDLDFLSSLSSGKESDLVALTGCVDGILSRSLAGDTPYTPQDVIEKLSLFEHLFVEVQPWNPPELNEALLAVADSNGLQVVVTADAHYADKDDKVAAEVGLLLSQVSSFKDSDRERAMGLFTESRRYDLMERINFLWPNRRLRFDKYDNYLLSRTEIEKFMVGMGIDRTDIYDNTVAIADLCDVELALGGNNLPRFSKMTDSAEFLKEVAWERFEKLGLGEEYVSRLEDELDIVIKSGFADYFLIIWDMVHASKTNGIMVGPGRGSVGGSLLAYVLGITEVDPIKFNLIFWRFLNLEIQYDPKFREIKLSRTA
jgi:DNA polymerase-3 subunit alpha